MTADESKHVQPVPSPVRRLIKCATLSARARVVLDDIHWEQPSSGVVDKLMFQKRLAIMLFKNEEVFRKEDAKKKVVWKLDKKDLSRDLSYYMMHLQEKFFDDYV